jgi:hypothetical protein
MNEAPNVFRVTSVIQSDAAPTVIVSSTAPAQQDPRAPQLNRADVAHPASEGSPSAFVFCAGLPGSASTWVLNVVLQLLRLRNDGSVPIPFFVDESAAAVPPQQEAVIARSLYAHAPAKALESSGCLVVKSHVPGPLMLRIARATRSPVIVSVRDPRDAVCSLMARFGLDFATSVAFVATSAEALATLDGTSLVLRYEDDFVSTAATVRTIAALVGATCAEADCARIAAEFSREQVAMQLKALDQSGTFDPDRPAIEQFDPRNHWHPGHVSDGRRDKWCEVLTAAENAEIVRAVRPFLDRFGYAPGLSPVCAGETVRFNVGAEGIGWLVSGFSVPEPWGIWTCETQATLRIALAVPVRAWLSLQIECRLAPSFLLDVGSAATISVNGRSLLRPQSQEGNHLLQLALWLEGSEIAGRDSVEIIFTFEGLRSPRELATGTDDRLLGIGLTALKLSFG